MNKEEGKEIVKAFALAGLPLVLPLIGTALLTLANECFNSSAKMRQDEWMKTLAEQIDKQDKSFAEKIKNTQNFASLFVNAQNGALTDVESGKIGLYANAFINAIKNERMEDTKKHLFLNMLREFTSAHLKILHLFYDEPSTERFMTLHVVSNHVKIYEENNEDFIHSLLSDLMKKGLLTEHPCGFSDGITYSVNKPASSALGCEFLSFISEQEKTND